MAEMTGPIRAIGFWRAAALFVAGFGLFMLCRRSDFLPYVPAMIVVAPILILRFSRTQPPLRSMLLTTLGFVLAFNIALWGVFDMGDPTLSLVFNLVRSTIIALYYALPYVIDRAVTPRLGRGLYTTLVFPAAMTSLMFVSSLVPPIDGTQAKNVFATAPESLLQLYALTGLWGFVFLWSWLAACVNYAWERGLELRPLALAGSVFAAVAGALTIWGALRIASAPDVPTVRLAAAVMPAEPDGIRSMTEVFDDRKTSPYEPTMATLASMVAEAASGGAKIVAFSEFAIVVREADRAAALAAFSRMAADHHIWMALPYGWVPPVGKGANRHLLIDDSGRIRADYQKRFLLGFGDFGENAVFEKGAEVIQTVETPFGRIALSICRDMSFPRFARQAGEAGADLMLVGSHEFPKGITVNDPHRAIENGYTQVRPTFDGITYAIDPYGRMLGRMDRGTGARAMLLVDVPTQGLATVYARFGDWLPWLSIAAVLLFSVLAVVNPDRSNAGAVGSALQSRKLRGGGLNARSQGPKP